MKKTDGPRTAYVGLTVKNIDPRVEMLPRANQADLDRMAAMLQDCPDANTQLSLVVSMLSMGMTWLKTAAGDQVAKDTMIGVFDNTQRQALELIQ